jgi:preprotein translocase subunit SecY
MFKTFINVFRVPELRNKILFTLLMLAIFRIGHAVPVPGLDQTQMAEMAAKQSQEQNSAAARLAAYVSLFSGGSLSHGTLFGLGVMPYISASIIFQLVTTVVPSLEKLSKEGESGRRKIQEWTRYATVPIAAMQGAFWLRSLGPDMIQQAWQGPMFWITGIVALTAGCVFLMWIGEQIDEYGLGQGISLIIMAGIVCRMPDALRLLIGEMNFNGVADPTRTVGPGKLLALAGLFIFVVATAILITQAQRRIPIMQAKHTRGRRVYGGQKQYLPLKVNIGGVMPVIFASSLMLFPQVVVSKLSEWLPPDAGTTGRVLGFLNAQFAPGQFLYVVLELVMIYFFAFFWTTVQFKPKEIANNLRDYGSFIPGLRPGKRTADYLEKVMMRMTYVGAAFLCLIAIVPTVATSQMGIHPAISQFLGGTGLLIVVSVVLDMVQRIETNLLTRNYAGFLGAGEGGKKIKGRN